MDMAYPDILPDVLPILCQPIKCQEQLGWEQLYHGHLSKNWAQAIDEIHPNLSQVGEQVMVKIVKTIWTYVLDTWKLRNQHLHKVANQLNLLNYKQGATTLYKLCYKLPPDAQAALY